MTCGGEERTRRWVEGMAPCLLGRIDAHGYEFASIPVADAHNNTSLARARVICKLHECTT